MKDRMNFFHVDQQLMPTGRGRRWRFGMQTHFRQGSSSGSIIDLPTLDASGLDIAGEHHSGWISMDRIP
jgi:hypothetical protein